MTPFSSVEGYQYQDLCLISCFCSRVNEVLALLRFLRSVKSHKSADFGPEVLATSELSTERSGACLKTEGQGRSDCWCFPNTLHGMTHYNAVSITTSISFFQVFIYIGYSVKYKKKKIVWRELEGIWMDTLVISYKVHPPIPSAQELDDWGFVSRQEKRLIWVIATTPYTQAHSHLYSWQPGPFPRS